MEDQNLQEQTTEPSKDEPPKLTFGRVISNLFAGALIGSGAILPGVSGGAMAAAFGVYRPMMDFFAHPIKNFKKTLYIMLPILIGFLAGTVLLADLVAYLMDISLTPVTCFFIGCIIATLPVLFKEADGRKWKARHWIVLPVIAAAAVAGLHAMRSVKEVAAALQPNTLEWYITWIVNGAIFALGAVVPGMSPSTILIYAGYYKMMSAGIGNLDMSIILPMGLGAVTCIALLSKAISWLFEKAGRMMYAIIMGIVVGSTVMILPLQGFSDPAELAISVIAALGGVILVWLCSKIGPKER